MEQRFIAIFSLELTPDEANSIYACMNEMPAKFSRTVLNKLDAVSRAQAEATALPSNVLPLKADER